MKKPHAPLPVAPAYLSKESQARWDVLVEEYGIADAGGLAVLETALQALDRLTEARKLIEREGAVVKDRFDQLRPHPAVQIERDARNGFLSAMRSLGIDGLS